MQNLIASDIFGRTTALETLAGQLAPYPGRCLIVDPYKGAFRHFSGEPAAYATFQSEVGLGAYIQSVRKALHQATQPLTLIGFSVGASAIWALSGGAGLPPGTRAFCFYGAQIRHYTAVMPRIDIELYFPELEPHFDVDDLVRRLSGRKGVVCHRTTYRHGFINPMSVNFDPNAYTAYLQILKEKIC